MVADTSEATIPAASACAPSGATESAPSARVCAKPMAAMAALPESMLPNQAIFFTYRNPGSMVASAAAMSRP